MIGFVANGMLENYGIVLGLLKYEFLSLDVYTAKFVLGI